MKVSNVIFVTSADAITPDGGGVQRCTREYLALAEAAGFAVHTVAYEVDRRPTTRLRRKFFARPYHNLIPPDFLPTILAAVRRTGAKWIFLNQVEPGLLAPDLVVHLKGSGVRIALLSHGSDSSDYLHEARIRAHQPGGRAIDRHDARWLGQQLFAELAFHRAVDVTFVLCETDREHAHWLGARKVLALPRTLEESPLRWAPVRGRIGTVSTLVHAPNVEGIVELAAGLNKFSGIKLRLVGGPEEAGRKLASRFSSIEYLGPIDNRALADEAATWCAFVNPIFCQPRGCSTKLAVPLSWRLPVVTTRAGARGYVWDENLIPFHDDPLAFAAESARLADPDAARAMAPAIAALAGLSPRLTDLAESFRTALA